MNNKMNKKTDPSSDSEDDTSLPILSETNYQRWKHRLRILLLQKNVWAVVSSDPMITEITDNAARTKVEDKASKALG